MTDTPDPRLYILMRTDMDSMNAGKGMAQAAHAANHFVHMMEEANRKDIMEIAQHTNHWRCWAQCTPQGFGTTIVLAARDEEKLKAVVDEAIKLGLPAGITHDPTYPVRDGEVMHLIPVDTCGFVFVPDQSDMPPSLMGMSLHP